MIKKLMSKALLTVFMDKKARKTLHAVRTAKDTHVAPSKLASPLADAQSEQDPLGYMHHDEITSLIRESLNKAKKEIGDTKKNPLNEASKSAIIQSRQDLIEKAITIHKSKSHIIDDLPTEQRKKLKLFFN